MTKRYLTTLFFQLLFIGLWGQSSQVSCLSFNLGTAIPEDSQLGIEEVLFPLTVEGYDEITAWVIDIEYDTSLLDYTEWQPTYFEGNEGPFVSSWPGHINIVFYGSAEPITIADGEQIGYFRFSLPEGEGSAAGSALTVEDGNFGAQAFNADFDPISVAVIEGLVPADLELGQFDPGQACMESLACSLEALGSIEIFTPDTITTPTYSWSYEGEVISTSQNLEGLDQGGRYDLLMGAQGQFDRGLAVFLLKEIELNPIQIEVLSQLDCLEPAATGSMRVSGFDPTVSTIRWSNDETTAQIDNLAEGFYWVQVTDTLSDCRASAFASINRISNRVVDILIEDDFRCDSTTAPNGSITAVITDLGGEPAPEWYNWSPSGTGFGPEVTDLGAGTYAVTIHGPNQACQTILETSIQTKYLSTAARVTQAECESGTGSIEMIAPIVGADYIWNNGANTPNLYGLESGTYSVTITSPNGCNLTDSYEILSPQLPEVEFRFDCIEDQVIVNLTDPLLRADFIWDGDTLDQDANASIVDELIAAEENLEIVFSQECSLFFAELPIDDACLGNVVLGGFELIADLVTTDAGPTEYVSVPISLGQMDLQTNDILDAQIELLYDPALLELNQVATNLPVGVVLNWEEDNGLITIDLSNVDLPNLDNGITFLLLEFRVLAELGFSPIIAQPGNWSATNGSSGHYSIRFLPGGVQLGQDEVWPGDANDNARVDHFDLLDIGLGYGLFGPSRPVMSTNWQPQLGPVWPGSSPLSGANWQHADADGNGIINGSDVAVLEANWNQTRPQTGLQDLNYAPVILQSSVAAPLFVLPDSVSNGSGLQSFGIHLGDEAYPAYDVYGLAFSLSYDPTAIDEEDVSVDFLETWLGQLDDDLVATYRNFPQNGRIDIAISRTDGESMNGMGRIATLHIIIEDVIFRGLDYELLFTISEQMICTPAGVLLYSDAQTTTSLINNPSSVYRLPSDERWQLYPNPAQQWVQLTHPEGLRPAEVQILDLAGREVYRESTPDYRLDLSNLPSGPYLIRILQPEAVTVKRLILR